MSLRTLFMLGAVVIALSLVDPVMAAPAAQESVDEVEVTSATTFTLTVRIDEVTTVAIPLQVDWRATGPTQANPDEVTVTISPTVLRTGFFSVTVGAVAPTTGTLAITLTQPVDEISPITGTATTTGTATATASTTSTVPTTSTVATTSTVPAVNGPTANTVVNLRAGPGTDYEIVGSADAGDVLAVVGQNSDGTWFILENGAWVAAFLVDNAPVDLPVVAPEATPLPTPTAPNILTPTATPTP